MTAPEENPPVAEILLLRHAKASRSGDSDFERALTRRGRRDAPRIARWMKARDLVPDHVIASPSRRTRETTELVLEEMGLAAAEVIWDERVYNADVPALLETLRACPATARRVLVVGHNPGLEDLVRHLGGATAREPEKGKFFPPCALARLRAGTELSAGSAPVIEIVSWSRKEHRWRIRTGEPHG